MIKVKNVDPKSVLRKEYVTIASISSCDTQRVLLPVAGYLEGVMVGYTAAVVGGQHWTVATLAGTTLIDFSQTLTTVASAVRLFSTNISPFFTAGTLVDVNTSSTANFAPVCVTLVVRKADKAEK